MEFLCLLHERFRALHSGASSEFVRGHAFLSFSFFSFFMALGHVARATHLLHGHGDVVTRRYGHQLLLDGVSSSRTTARESARLLEACLFFMSSVLRRVQKNIPRINGRATLKHIFFRLLGATIRATTRSTRRT